MPDFFQNAALDARCVRHKAELTELYSYSDGMKAETYPIVVSAEKLYGGDVLLTFSDGRCVVYSGTLLRSMAFLTEDFNDQDFEAGGMFPDPPHSDLNRG